MKAKFLDTVKKYNMFEVGDRVVVGLSGGADSMCLTLLLLESASELGITVECAHVNHCIRGAEADSDEEYVRNFCQSKSILLHTKRADIPKMAKETGESTELCARRVRYQFFDSLKADKIATAHTGSDRVETMLMNLSRGCALNGLCSIPPVRGNIVRPLIEFTRDDTEKYCRENFVEFVTDSTNLSVDYTRNKFRHTVINELKSINPSFEKNALRCLDSINTDNDFLDSYISKTVGECTNDDRSFNLCKLQSVDKRMIPRIIAMYIGMNCNSDFEKRHIEEIETKFYSTFCVTLPGNITVKGNEKKLWLANEKNDAEEPFNEICFSPERQFVYKNGKKKLSVYFSQHCIADGKNVFAADADKVCEILCLRTRRAGDKIFIGRRRCSKTLKKLFTEDKVELAERNRLLILSDEKGLIFLEKYGVDASRQPDKTTKKFLIIKLEDDKNE